MAILFAHEVERVGVAAERGDGVGAIRHHYRVVQYGWAGFQGDFHVQGRALPVLTLPNWLPTRRGTAPSASSAQ